MPLQTIARMIADCSAAHQHTRTLTDMADDLPVSPTWPVGTHGVDKPNDNAEGNDTDTSADVAQFVMKASQFSVDVAEGRSLGAAAVATLIPTQRLCESR